MPALPSRTAAGALCKRPPVRGLGPGPFPPRRTEAAGNITSPASVRFL